MFLLYVMCMLPAIFGGVMWLLKKSITWWEWAAGVGLAFLISAIMHAMIIYGMTSDTETWSGWVMETVHYPYWHEYYTTTETTTDSKGNVTGTRIVHHHIDHPEHWGCYDNIGGYHGITRDFHVSLKGSFGGKIVTKRPWKSSFDRGDRNTYHTPNETEYVEPVNIAKSFENRVKAAPSVFSYTKVPDTVKVFEYPYAKDWNQSKRVLGTSDINIRSWDQMNARLGPTKKVNVILCFFSDKDSGYGQWQEAKWIGGKKNDLVLCCGGEPGESAKWSYVFGWTESELVKRNLESILLENPVDTTIIPIIEAETIANYELKDWSKFDYITIEPPGWCFILLFFLMLASQGGFYYWAHINDFRGLSIDGRDPEPKRRQRPRWPFRRRKK